MKLKRLGNTEGLLYSIRPMGRLAANVRLAMSESMTGMNGMGCNVHRMSIYFHERRERTSCASYILTPRGYNPGIYTDGMHALRVEEL